MKRQLMLEQWNEFSRRVLPVNASEVQRREMKRAFYAGAQAILFRVIVGFTPESDPTEEDLRMIDGIDRELQDFTEAVKAGRA